MGAHQRMTIPAWEAVDLAPANPYGLLLATPLLLGPGCSTLRDIDPRVLGATVTRTATRHTRRDDTPIFAATPSGMVVSTLPTVSIRTLLKEEGRRWERAPLPVIVSLRGDAAELGEMAAIMEGVEGVAALLLDAEGGAAPAVQAARAVTPRPIVAFVQPGPDIAQRARDLVAAGADALIVIAPPSGAANPSVVGALLGPAVFPLTVQALLTCREATDV